MKSSRKRRRRIDIAFAARIMFVFAIGLVPGSASAAPITLPSGLNSGEQYRLAFVTSTVRSAASTNIADYNAFVTTAAMSVPDLAALGTTWSAIASTLGTNAWDNTSTYHALSTGVPLYRLDGSRIATSNRDLWDGTIAVPINVTEGGSVIGESLVWTGTDTTGFTEGGNGGLGFITPDFPTLHLLGLTTAADAGWIQGAYLRDTDLSEAHSFYAISGVLTVVPEPGGFALLTLVVPIVLRRR